MSACACGRTFRVSAISCNLTVLQQETVAPDIRRLTVQWQDPRHEPHAGQFYMLRAWAADATPILSRPISVNDFDNQTGALTFLYQLKGEGTHKIAALQPGQTLTVTTDPTSREPAAGKDAPFIGNRNSMIVHSANCAKLPGEDNRVYFNTAEEAEEYGYQKHTCIK